MTLGFQIPLWTCSSDPFALSLPGVPVDVDCAEVSMTIFMDGDFSTPPHARNAHHDDDKKEEDMNNDDETKHQLLYNSIY